jgi:putative peptide zinc metalloprotease protein
MFALMVINAPRLFATGWDSFWTHYDVVGPAFDKGQSLRGIRAALQMVVLALPAIGFVYTLIRIAGRGGRGAWRWSAGSPVRRAGVTLAGAAVVGAIAFTWWPNGDYRPIQPGERGTLTGGFKQIANAGSGRAALTPQRQLQLGGAPTQRSQEGSAKQQRRDTQGRAKKASSTGSSGAVTQQPGQANGDSTQTTPDQTASPQPDAQTPAQDPQQTQTTPDPSASGSSTTPDQTSTQPQQQAQPQPQDGSTQMTPPPTTPTSP